MAESERAEKITINLSIIDLGQIDLLVREGFYTNRTDFIRTAVRNQLSASGEAITLADAATLPQIVFSSTYDLRSTTDEAFRDAGLMPEVVLEGAEMDAVLRFVERGLGVAIVPAMVLIDRPGLRSVRLEEPTLTRTISLARPSDVAPTAAVDVMPGISSHSTIPAKNESRCSSFSNPTTVHAVSSPARRRLSAQWLPSARTSSPSLYRATSGGGRQPSSIFSAISSTSSRQ